MGDQTLQGLRTYIASAPCARVRARLAHVCLRTLSNHSHRTYICLLILGRILSKCGGYKLQTFRS
jgi:hypothetical protein